ncbi:MAG: hypothetical protein KUG71_11655 [Porticoccaceae bacterium]|nr:hypothetical protein [Porticoccaceae bacterium]
MRLVGRILLFAVVLGLGIWLGNIYLLQSKNFSTIPYALPEDVETTVSKVYLVTEGKPLEFKLSQAPKKIRLSSAARIIENESAAREYTYSLLYEFVNKAGDVLSSHTHSYLTEPEQTIVLDSQTVPLRFFNTRNYLVGKIQSIYFTASEFKRAELIRITLLDKSELINDIGISVYKKSLTNSKLAPDVVWARYSEQQKNNKAKWNALPPEFIHQDEKKVLAEYRWAPIAPGGTLGADFKRLSLYRLSLKNGLELNPLRNNVVDNLADNDKAVTFPVHKPGQVKFKLSHDFLPNKSYQISILWHPPHNGATRNETLDFDQSEVSFVREFERGLVEIRSTIPVSVLAISDDVDVLPDDRHMYTAYLVDKDQGIDFSIQSDDQTMTPASLDVRKFTSANHGSSGAEVKAQYWWLDKAGKVVRMGFLKTSNVPDPYRQLPTGQQVSVLYRSVPTYFMLPPEVKTIQVTSDAPILTRLSISPLNIKYFKQLPRHKRSWFDDAEAVAPWYNQKPGDWRGLERSQRKFLLRRFHTPVTIAPEILSGDFHNQGTRVVSANHLWRDLMVPFVSKQQVLSPNLAYIYSPVSSGKAFTQASDQNKAKRTRLFFLRSSEQPSPVRLSINDQRDQEYWMVGRWDLIELDGIVDGSNVVNFLDNDDRWYMNHQVAGGEEAYRLRRATGITENQSVSFLVSKTSEKTSLVLRYFSLKDKPARLSVKINDAPEVGAYSAFTRRRHRWQLSALNGAPGYVLKSDRQVGGEHQMSFGLYSDLPQQDYEITVTLEEGEGYVALNQVSIGAAAKVTVYKADEGGEHD